MGLFDNLFKKKNCDICGNEIGLLGNRKLEDGNLCKDCAEKLSPWFDDRRHSTVEMIRSQLEMREANKQAVAAFNISRTYGELTKIYVDEQKGNFMATSARNPKDGNPDVIALSAITNCEIDISEHRTELKRDGANGEKVSYSPPRYTYDYDFYIELYLNHPYIDDIRFKLNSREISVESRGLNPNPEYDTDYRRYNTMAEEIRNAMLNRPNTNQQSAMNPQQHAEAMIEAQKNAMEEAVKQVGGFAAAGVAAAAAAPAGPVTCPYCGASTTPDTNGNCEYCGGPVK